MKKITVYCLLLLFFLPLAAHPPKGDIIPQSDWQIRATAGASFANRVGTRESSWYSHPKESSCGFQYGIDVLHYHKHLGYGIAFKHYMHDVSFPSSELHSSLQENTRILYVAPQFSNVNEDIFFKGMTSNIDLGIGYAHYLSDGTINGKQKYSAPRSGLGVNLNIGLEYKFSTHWGTRLSISGEYYFFKNLHQGKEYPDAVFEPRSKLKIFMVTPQISLVYHL